MVLACLGCSGAGKTLLLKKLAPEPGVGVHTRLIPTVGVNLFALDVAPYLAASRDDRGRKKRRNRDRDDRVRVKELGGQLVQNWTDYLQPPAQDDDAGPRQPLHVVYVVDAASLDSLCELAVEFVRVLDFVSSGRRSAETSSHLPRVLIVYSKVDLVSASELTHRLRRLRSVLRLDELISWYAGRIAVEEVCYSAQTDQGLPYIKDWLLRASQDQRN